MLDCYYYEFICFKKKISMTFAKIQTSFEREGCPWGRVFTFTARCYASAVLAMALCLSVRPSVSLSVHHKSVFY